MNDEVHRLLELVYRAQAAWDQYNIQLRLPDQPRWLPQGHPWDPYNSGMAAPQARRDPQVMSAAWNDLETTLLELSYSAQRLEAEFPAATVPSHVPVWYDVRTGAFTPRAPSAALARRPEEDQTARTAHEARVPMLAGG